MEKRAVWKLKIISWTLLAAFVAIFFLFAHFHNRLGKIKRRVKRSKIYVSKVEKGNVTNLQLANTQLPIELQNIPFSDSVGVVVNTKNISIRNVIAPYNASIVEKDGRYLMFFRYDQIVSNNYHPYHTFIGCVELDEKFDQTKKEFIKVNTGSKFSEDPRAFEFDNEIVLVYNDLISQKTPFRSICVGKYDDRNGKLHAVTQLNLQFQPLEKNWTPFVLLSQGQPKIHFEYYLYPHKILKLPDLLDPTLTHLSYPHDVVFQQLHWPVQWGIPRGGTPAKKIGDEYLAFFHSAFEDRAGITWYLMGAYTFESQAPFRITKVSHYPILFEGIYDTPSINTAHPSKRVLFPSGFVVEKKGDKELIHVTCGENDCAVKIVTLDQKQLLKNLKQL